MKVIKKIEILVLEGGEVLIYTTPATSVAGVKREITSANPITKTSSKTTQATQRQLSSVKSSTSKTSRKTATKKGRSFLITRIRELIQKHGNNLISYLKQADVDVDNLENMTDKQIKRAIALALNYDTNPLGVGVNNNTEETETEISDIPEEDDELGF